MDTKGQPQTMPGAGTQTTISQLLRQGTRVLAESSASARLDAELLLGHVLDTSRVRLFIRHAEPVDTEAGNRYLQLIEQRIVQGNAVGGVVPAFAAALLARQQHLVEARQGG